MAEILFVALNKGAFWTIKWVTISPYQKYADLTISDMQISPYQKHADLNKTFYDKILSSSTAVAADLN